MANRTVKDARNIHGTNPQYLIEKIIRSRIYDSKFWKEQCFALTAELLVDKAMEIRFVGGVFGGNIRPTPFLCLTLKMLQIQPEKDIVVEFIKNEEFKYVRALGAFYLRLTGTSMDCYKYLEPLYNDNRKLRQQNRAGQFEIIHMDEYIDELLRSDRVCDIILPRVQKRLILEENNELEPKVSALDDDLDEDMASDDEVPTTMEKSLIKVTTDTKKKHKKDPERSRSKDRDRGAGGGPHEQRRERERAVEKANQQKDLQRERDRKDREREREMRDRERDRNRHDQDSRGSGNRKRDHRERDDRDYGGSGRDRDREKYRNNYWIVCVV